MRFWLRLFRQKKLWIGLLCLTEAFAQSFSSNTDCLQPKLVGACIWIVCTPYGCNVSVRPKIGHFNPDVWVYVTNPQGIDRVEDPKRQDTQNWNHNNLIQHDAVAIGHPLTGSIYCPSNTDAGMTYFISALDTPTWRTGGLDLLHPGAFIPGLNEIGRWPLNTWGHVMPRTGWTVQAEEPKSAAVVAQRVGDVITRDFQPHVYLSILGNPVFIGNHKIAWSPGSLVENNNSAGWWQLDYLLMNQANGQNQNRGDSGLSDSGSSFDSMFSLDNMQQMPGGIQGLSCLVFGQFDLLQLRGWGGGKVATDGEYLHTLWRPYTCCEIEDGVLVVIDLIPYPFPVVTN